MMWRMDQDLNGFRISVFIGGRPRGEVEPPDETWGPRICRSEAMGYHCTLTAMHDGKHLAGMGALPGGGFNPRAIIVAEWEVSIQ